MKLIVFTAVLIFIPLLSTAQSQDTVINTLSKADYLKKSRQQNTAGWVLFTAGSAGLLATALVDVLESTVKTTVTVVTLGLAEPEPKRSYKVPYLISAGTVIASIPFLSASAKNKRHASQLTTSFKVENATVPIGATVTTIGYPSLALKLRL